MIELTGTVQEIQETKSYPKKDGSGNVDITKLKIADKYFTCFNKEQLEGIIVGSEVDVSYTERENEYEGKKYINNNISILKLHGVPELAPETQAKIDAMNNPKGENIVKVGNKTFKVTIEEIS